MNNKKIFYKRVYFSLALAFLVFLAIESFFLTSEIIVNFMLSMLEWYRRLMLLLWFGLVTYFSEKMAISSTKKFKQYLAYLIYIIAEALLFVPIILIALAYTDMYLIWQAVLLTFMLFIWLSVVAFTIKKDFSFLRSGIIIGTFIAIWLIIAGISFWFNLWLVFSLWMILLASASILYQTSNIKNKYLPEQYIAASLWLFSALMLLFWYVIRILLIFTKE